MIVELLLTGDELMSGDTVDSNSSMIAKSLSKLGVSIYRKTTIGDNFTLLCDTIQQLCKNTDVLIINGGLGPTIDDLTAEALANATGSRLMENKLALEHLDSWCGNRGLTVNAANRKQALLPENCSLVANPIGSAVGFSVDFDGCLVICTPGVPSELRLMLSEQIIPLLSEKYPDHPKVSIQRLQIFGIGESTLQQMVSDKISDWPEQIELGFRAGAPLLEVKLTCRDTKFEHLQKDCLKSLNDLFGAHIIGLGDAKLPQTLVNLLTEKGLQMTTAESCTGGLIASQLTSVAGASQVFEAGFVSYSNTIKQSLLGVSATTLDSYGAVSEEVVKEMAQGALNKSGADYVIAVSGIAGPDGGTEEKPVGTVWLAWGNKNNIKTKRLLFRYHRQLFQTMVAAAGLDLIRRELLEIESSPHYFREKRFRD